MSGIEIYIILRAITYVAVGFIALSRRIYAVTALMAALTVAALTPEIIELPVVQASLKYVIPLTVLWIGWDIMHNSKRP